MGTGLLGLDETEENPLYLSKEEALSTEVLPRSRGLEPSSRTAIAVPAVSATPPTESKMSLASILDARLSTPAPQTTADVGQEKRQSLSNILDSRFGMTAPSTEPVIAKPAEDTGDFMRGAGTALAQTPALAYGALGFAGAAGENLFGTGGSMSAIKKFGLDQYQTRMKEIGATAKESDDVTKAWAKAKQGDIGALADWAQYGVGYLGGNIIETVATSAFGSVIGGLTAGPVGAVGGATAGVVGKEAVKGVAKNLIEGMVAKEAVRLAEGQAVKSAVKMAEKDVANLALSVAVRQQATKNVAKNIGSSMALVGSSLIKETGGIYGEAEEQAGKEGRELDGGDLARIFGSGVVAGLSEFAVDKLGLDVAAGKIKIPGGGRTGRTLIGGAAGVGFEGGTELFQTAVERFGAGKSLAGEDAMNEYINAFALGGLGGGTVGAVVGAFRDGKTSPDRVRQILDQAQSDMTSGDGRQELFDAMVNDERIGPILQANGIESGDDPRFQNVITKALATQRMLIDLEAPTPEVKAVTRKQREADVLAAFGETASTAIGGDTGAIEPVIQRSSVTPNLETRTLEGEAQPVILPETAGGQAGTVALSPEDLVARQEGFEPLIGITTEAGPVGNRFASVQAAETFLFGPKDKETGQRSGGYAQTNLAEQGLDARIRQGKRSKAEGGGTFYFVETRKSPAEVAAAPAIAPAPPMNEAGFIPEPPAQVSAQVGAVRSGTKSIVVTTKNDLKGVSTTGLTRVTVKDPETGVESVLVSKDKTIGAKAQKLIADVGFKPAMGQLLGYVEPTATTTPPADAVVVQQKDAAGNIVQEEIVPAAKAGKVKKIKGTTTTVTTPAVVVAERQIQSTQGEPDATQVGVVAPAELPSAPPANALIEAKADEVMSYVDKMGGTAITRDQVIKLIEEKGMAAADKSIAEFKKTISDRDRASTAKAVKQTPETKSWVIRNKDTGDVVMETFDKSKVDAINSDKYEAVPSLQHLQELNAKIKAAAAATAKPAIDPALQARVKERINKAYEDGALDIEDVIALNEMADQGDLMGAITQMKKTAEANKGAGAKYALKKEAGPTTTEARDFAYAKLKTVDDLNKEVRGHLERRGGAETFTAKRVPLGNLAGKIPGIPAMQRIADLFGKKLVYFAVEKGSSDFLDGAVLSGSDTIFVNIDSSLPHVRILGHEMVHALRFSDPKLYGRLVTHLTPYLDQTGMSRYRQIMAQEGMKDPALILEEAVADIVGDRFGESSFWQMMADENPTMFQQLARVVLDFLDSVMAKLRSNQTLDSKNLLTDVAAARQAVASVLAAFDQKQTATAQPTGMPAFSQKKMDLPAEPGTQSIPDGYVRLYHQTDTESLSSIAKEGLSIQYAKGIEGPRAIYAGETPFYGPVETRPTLEFIVPKDQWEAPFVLQDVQPNQIIAAHYPWHRRVRYLEDNPASMQKALAGEFDDLDGDYRLAVQYVKDKYGKAAEDVAPTMFSRKAEGETFYSAMERGFESVKQTSMPAQQWKAWLNSNKSQLGIKNAEIEWTGINEWLDLQEGKVEKQNVLNWIAGNKVKLNDIILTDNPSVELEYKDPTDGNYREFVRDEIEKNYDYYGDDVQYEDENPQYFIDVDSLTGEEAKQWIKDNSSLARFNREHTRGYERAFAGAKDRLAAKYNKSTGRITTVLPHGTDYAEIILTDPSIRPYKEEDTVHFGDIAYGKHIGWLRVNVRKDADDNDVLFLEEIQSQRAQEGREFGIFDSKRTELPAGFTVYQDFGSLARPKNASWYVINNSTKKQVGIYGKTKEEAIESALRSGVLDAPFIEETKAWVSLLLKRAIAYAQTKGIDRIAWTTGDQQNQRYRLSEAVDEIYYDSYEDGKTFQVTALKDGNEVGQVSGQMDLEKIRRAYGKDIAKMIADGTGEQGDDSVKVIRGEFDVGGAGMREFYNTIVASVAKEITKASVSPMYVVTADPYMGARLQVVQQEGGKYQLVEVYKEKETPVSRMFDTFQEADNEKMARYEAESKGAQPQMGFVIPEKLQEQVANDGFPMFSRKKYEEQFSDVSPDTRNRALNKGFYSPPTIKERLDHLRPNFMLRIVQGTFDKFRSVRDISKKAYLMLRMSSGSQDGAVSTLLHYGQVFNDDGALNVKKGTQGLLEVLDPVGGEVDRFLLWIAANRAAALSKDERERFFSPEDIKSLRGLNMGTMKNGKSRIGVYADTLKNMNELNRSVLDVARDTGLIDAEGYKRFAADIWYIPFYRQMEDDGSLSAAQTSSGSVGQYLSKKLKGSERPLNDLMENVLMNWTHILSASMKNQAAVETLTSAMQIGDVVTKLDSQEKGAVKVMEKGKETFYRIDDEFLLASLSAVSQMPSYGWGMDIMRGFKTTLTRFISLSPTFKINNLIRDSIQSIGLSELSASPMGNVMQGWRAYKTDRAEALAGGGLFAMGNAFDGDQSASVKRLLKTGVNKLDILDTPEKVASFFGKMQDKYDDLSDASENANRLALYQQLRAKGASHLEASYAARDLQDFSLQGSWSAIRYAAQVLPYFNARLQGMYKLGRDGLDPTMQVLTGKASDTERQKAAKFSAVTGAVVTAAMILYLSQKDDEDWKKREDWDRDAFFWFKIPGTDKAARIPKPFEMGAIATLVERMTEQMVDSQIEGKVFGKRLLAVLHDTFAINPIPQAIRPLYDIARNKDGFTDRPIESMGMERISVQNRVSPGTSAAAVALGTVNNLFAEFVSKATGGAISTQSTQLSPIQYDYMLKGYLGWVGTVIQTASNVMATPFKDGSSSRYERIDDFLVVGNFVKTAPQSQSRYVTSFYENSKDIATASADVSHFLNSGQFDKANEIYLEKSDKLALAKLYTKGTNMMSSISNQVKMIEDDKVMSGAEKRLEIDRLQQVRIQIAKSVEDMRISSKKKFADGGEVRGLGLKRNRSGVGLGEMRHGGGGTKGSGYFGPLDHEGGDTSTELSAESSVGEEYPTIVPTLTKKELEHLLSGEKPTDEIYEKAESWAKSKIDKGESPFASRLGIRAPLPEE